MTTPTTPRVIRSTGRATPGPMAPAHRPTPIWGTSDPSAPWRDRLARAGGMTAPDRADRVQQYDVLTPCGSCDWCESRPGRRFRATGPDTPGRCPRPVSRTFTLPAPVDRPRRSARGSVIPDQTPAIWAPPRGDYSNGRRYGVPPVLVTPADGAPWVGRVDRDTRRVVPWEKAPATPAGMRSEIDRSTARAAGRRDYMAARTADRVARCIVPPAPPVVTPAPARYGRISDPGVISWMVSGVPRAIAQMAADRGHHRHGPTARAIWAAYGPGRTVGPNHTPTVTTPGRWVRWQGGAYKDGAGWTTPDGGHGPGYHVTPGGRIIVGPGRWVSAAPAPDTPPTWATWMAAPAVTPAPARVTVARGTRGRVRTG